MTEPQYRLDKHPQMGYQPGTNHTRLPLPIAWLLTPAEAVIYHP